MDFFTEVNKINANNFPSSNILNSLLDEQNFNKILLLIRGKIIEANTRNDQYIRMMNPELISFNQKIVDSVKKFLLQKEYIITNIENENLALIGWKLSWKVEL